MRPPHVTTFAISFFFKNVFSATLFVEIPPFLGTFCTPIEMEHTLHGYSIANAIKEDGTPSQSRIPTLLTAWRNL